MSSTSKITGINLAILLFYSLFIRFNSRGSEGALSILIFSAFAIAAHVFILLIICAILYAGGQKDKGRAFLLSSGLVLLIGFSSCWANAMA